ncbi:peptidoglycan recognition protein family protein [Streptomyces tendae]|uniref:peptidoglycan recognition protein family protein n=1 Tax=Streptomyces tendae TaxID=1932 RepID=UPI00248F8C49|nr:peptidoglycan recognition family protein [Streptomyces tendae]
MKLVTRAQLGWPASAAPSQTSTKGVKVHYEGAPVSKKLLSDHNACIAEWKAIRASHLANKAENYSDVAYNYAACPHGYLLEGRGLRKRTGANGNQALNQGHYAIVGLVGSEGLTQPTDAMLSAIRDGIDLLRKNGAGSEIKGHRDGYATACPGGPLYAWVQKGAPRPTTKTPVTEEDPMASYSKAEIGDAVLYRDNIPAPKAAPDKSKNPNWSLSSYAQTILNTLDALRSEVDSLRVKVDALSKEN